ncbi:MAG: 5-formyltetrahydrofolate cyclo-ligase [Chitinophagaceae bacterium]
MLKKEARKFYRQQRDLLSASDRMKNDDLILIQLQTVDLPFLSSVLSFYPIEEKAEINTFSITDYLRFRNPALQICYPKADIQTHSMKAVACYADTIFVANEYNIPEPVGDEFIDSKDLDLVLLPMLAFDKKGHRIGYGKGFYDRFLKECRHDCLKIGLSYFEPLDSINDAGEFDVTLDFCITPQQVYVF